MPPPITAGLSELTKKFSTGDPNQYRTSFSSGESPEEKYDKYTSLTSGITFHKFPPDLPEYKIILVSRDYHPVTGTLSRPQSTAVNGYVLPLPQITLMDKYDIQYDDNAQLLSIFRGQRLGVVGDIIAKVGQLGKFAGINLNKFKTVLLEAPVLKRHHFTWKLSPKNYQESLLIRDIVNNLKADAAPVLTATFFFLFPHIFDIYFEPNAAFMYGFKPSVIESVAVDYNSDNPHPALYWGKGAPESITLTISFIEIEIWVKEDYDNWNKAIADDNLHPTETLRKPIIDIGT